MALIDFVQTHLRVLALTLPWVTSKSGEFINSEGDKKEFVIHSSLFRLNTLTEANVFRFGRSHDAYENKRARYDEVAVIIAILVISLLISVWVYITGKDRLGKVVYTALYFMQWVFDLIVIGLFYGYVDDSLNRMLISDIDPLKYDPISFGLFALIGCLLVSTFHVSRLLGEKTGVWTFGHVRY